MPQRRHIDSISHGSKRPVAAPLPAAPEPSKATPSAPEAELPAADRFEALFPQPTVSVTHPPAWAWVIIVLVVVGGLSYLGYALANGKVNAWLTTNEPTAQPTTTSSPTPTPTPSATPTPTPSPSATPTPSISSISIRVLNGTGSAGAAAAVKSTLEQAGFSVRTTGNAKSQSYTQTVIYYKTGKEDQAKLVQSALSKYPSSLQQSDSLAAPDDVLVVVGPKN